MSDRQPLAAQNIYHLRQGVELLRALPAGAFAELVLSTRSGSVGGQFRHCIDYYDCFLRDLERGSIDYDDRRRRAGLEADSGLAIAEVGRIISRLERIGADQEERAIRIKADHFGAGTDEGNGLPVWQPSSIGRELVFLLSHTVHHYALIALMLRGQDLAVPRDFGVAPSTLDYWKDSAGCAP